MRHRSFVRLAAGVALALAAGLGAAVAADLWAQLGVKETEARGQVGYALTSGHVPYYLAAKAFKAASPAVRASLVTEGVKWAKVYVASAEFKAAYLSLRDGHKPGMPAAKGTPEQRVKAMLDDQRKQLEETKKNLTQMPPDVRKQMEPALAQMEAQIQKTAGDAAMLGMLKQGFATEAKEDEERYRQNVAAWQKAYPADPSALVASRLREFLDASAAVDYSAKLVKRGSVMVFADPGLEDKSSEWKLCYRAGREAVDAAREAAKAWITEIEKR